MLYALEKQWLVIAMEKQQLENVMVNQEYVFVFAIEVFLAEHEVVHDFVVLLVVLSHHNLLILVVIVGQ